MFDIASTSLAENFETGTFMPFLNPATGEPHMNEAGQPIGVVMRSRLSRAAQNYQHTVSNKRLEQARRGQDNTVEGLEAETTELLAACTVSWNFDSLDGQPFPCTQENARRFWGDHRFRAHRERANQWIGNEANFTKR